MTTENHAYREGRSDAPVLLLLVAGRPEGEADRPAAGAAKGHLDEILSRLNQVRPDLAPYAKTDEYSILNAHPGVEYAALTQRTEPPVGEYTSQTNVERVRAIIGDRRVIAFGGRAMATCRAAKIIPVMSGRHPSSLNRIRNDEVGAATPAERSSWRYSIAACQMLRSAQA